MDAHMKNHKANEKINDKVDRILKNNNHKSETSGQQVAGVKGQELSDNPHSIGNALFLQLSNSFMGVFF